MAGQRHMIPRICPRTAPLVKGPCSVLFGAGTMLLINEGSSCRLSLQRPMRDPEIIDLNRGGHLLVTTQQATAALRGARTCQFIDENRLSQMPAFVDAALGVPERQTAPVQIVTIQSLPREIAADSGRLEHWLALEVMRGGSNQPLIAHLRRQEAYLLTSYLLRSPPGDCAQLNQLCKRYGLSYSHFRRLCCRALGGAPKPRLRIWRASRALLDLLDGERPVLRVALENGYTSASHISIDIKQLFGVTPRMVKNASTLLP